MAHSYEYKHANTHYSCRSHKHLCVEASSPSHAVALLALTIALMVVGAWISVPLGPVPFTLQTFALMLALMILPLRLSVAATACYLLLGAIGLPVFASMHGGLGIYFGPTGGFIWGFFLGMVIAGALCYALENVVHNFVVTRAIAGVVFSLVVHVCGLMQFMAVMHADIVKALMVTTVPFAVVDVLKIVVAVIVASAVVRALRHRAA